MEKELNHERGLFITFEGGECTGKTTQSKILYEHLKSLSIPVIWTREIGGTETAEKIRELMLGSEMHAMTEMFLSMAARYEHVHDLIIPSLSSGITVICDRFIDSTAVYRNIDDKIKMEEVYFYHSQIFGNFWPDITFLIDVDPEISLARLEQRGVKNRFDVKSPDFHLSVREKFLKTADMYKLRIKKIDGSKFKEIISEEILKCVEDFIDLY
jgi:dTMP kinase